MKAVQVLIVTVIAGVTMATAAAAPLGTAFAYQGQLKKAGVPISGTCDLQLSLWNSFAAGTQIGSTQTVLNVPVSNGLFTVLLNTVNEFGASAFNGEARWLQIAVRSPAGSGSYTTLAPKQELTAAPYALFALNADRLDGLDASAFLQSIPVPLTLSGTQPVGHIIKGVNASTSGFSSGVFGESTAATGATFGVRGHSDSTAGTGVIGYARASTGTTYGGYFWSESTSGRGVYGLADASSGTNYGGYFQSDSTSGRGVYGEATAATGTTYGGYFSSDSTSGRGLQATATATSGTTYAGRFTNSSTSGYGVHALASATSGTNYGVVGETDSTSGYGVLGFADAASGSNYGVFGQSDSTEGVAVAGLATAKTGAAVGVQGQSGSTNGYGVYGNATSATGFTRGVKGTSVSPDGTGVLGEATGSPVDAQITIGVHGWAKATAGQADGVMGETDSVNGKGVSGRVNVTDAPDAVGGSFWHGGNGTGAYGQSVSGKGVYGYSISMSGTNYGVYGRTNSSAGYGVYSRGDLRVDGDLSATGSKIGYVSDIVMNGGTDPLECGDVVEIIGSSAAVTGDIPVVIVRKAQTANSTRVLGPIECAMQLTPREAEHGDSTSIPRVQYESLQFHAHKSDGAIQPGAYGRAVTLGAFKAIKVDASLSAIEPGDPLVASATPGYAMRVRPIGELNGQPVYPSGCIIGKALGSLSQGIGTMPVLVQSR